MTSTVGSVFSSFDLLDFQFQLRPISVFSHPLLIGNHIKNVDSVEVSKRTSKKESVQSNGGNESWKEQQNFVDPLNAPSIDIAQSASAKTDISLSCQNGDVSLDTFAGFSTAILTTKRLDNTLAEPDSEEWPLEGLDPQLVGHRPWGVLRHRVLEMFTSATDKLSLESSFLKGNEAIETAKWAERSGANEPRRRQKGSVIEKQQKTVTKFHELTEDEWTRKLKELRRILLMKWEAEKRLECIKLTAEVAALISTNILSAQFYPSQFVHVSDFLDLFGHLVYERLLRKATDERRAVGVGALPAHFDTNDVLEETRVKARNWFGKVNEMAALLAPRIYLLTALLPCQRFMDPLPAIQENLLELCQSVKQVQHPLISSYLRCYICRVAMRLNAADRAPHWKCLNDWLQTYSQQPVIQNLNFNCERHSKHLLFSLLTFLLGPAMEWVVQCVAFNAVSYADLHPLWEYCRLPERRPVVLLPMLNALPRLYLGEHALEACRIVTGSELVSGEELCAFGANLLETDLPMHSRKPILKAVWKCIMRLASLKQYMACCECWMEFAARYFGTNELNVMLDSMLTKLGQQQHQDKYGFFQQQLYTVLRKVFAHSRDVSALFDMDVFSKLVDTFSPGPIREEVFLVILRAIVAKHSVASFTGIDLAYQVLSMCQSLHDCVEPSSPDDRIDVVVSLISASLDRVDLSADPDQCLDFLVACRASLANIDALQKYVLLRVQAFTLHIVRSVRYSNSRTAFLQGCLANLFISTPSLVDPLDQIRFSIHSTQIALAAFAFFQVDSFVAFILDTFDTLSPSVALLPRILQLGTLFLATLAHVPLEQQSDDDWDQEEAIDDQGQPAKPLKHFRRFLCFVLRFWHNVLPFAAASPSSISFCSPPTVYFVHLIVRCLHYLCVIWPTVYRGCVPPTTAADPTDQQEDAGQQQSSPNDGTIFEHSMVQQQLQLQHGEDEHYVDQQWHHQPNVAQLRNICIQCAEQIADNLKENLTDENASDEICLAGVELLELIAQFGPVDAVDEHEETSVLPNVLRVLAKTIYKLYKRKPALRKRILRMTNK